MAGITVSQTPSGSSWPTPSIVSRVELLDGGVEGLAVVVREDGIFVAVDDERGHADLVQAVVPGDWIGAMAGVWLTELA